MEFKQKVEINFQFTRKNGVGDRKKVELILPRDVVYKLSGQEKGLPIIIPYLYSFIKEGEKITWYTYRVLIQDVDAENKKIEDQKRKELEKQQKEELKQKKILEEQAKENERLKKELDGQNQELKRQKRKTQNIDQTIENSESDLDFQDTYDSEINRDKDEVEVIKRKEKRKESEPNSYQSEEKKTERIQPRSHTEKEKKDFEFSKKPSSENNPNYYQLEKEKIDLAFYKQQKEAEIKQQKIDNAKKELDNGGSKFIYFLKRLWIFLDKPWKKIVFCIIVFYGFLYFYQFVTQSKDRTVLLNANVQFQEFYVQAQKEVANKNMDNVKMIIIKMDSLKTHLNVSNEFLIDEKNKIETDWNDKKKALEKTMNLEND